MASAVKLRKGHIREGNPVWTAVLYVLAILAGLICIKYNENKLLIPEITNDVGDQCKKL